MEMELEICLEPATSREHARLSVLPKKKEFLRGPDVLDAH